MTYVCTGEGEPHLLTLEHNAAVAAAEFGLIGHNAWKGYRRKAYWAVFYEEELWDIEAMYRLGRAYATTESQIPPSSWDAPHGGGLSPM